jgi:hypothetical protein
VAESLFDRRIPIDHVHTVKVKKGRDERSFYNLTEYEEWRAEFGQENGGA